MGTLPILQIARDVAAEVGLTPPVTLFGYLEGDQTAVQLRRAMEWTCRYLARHFEFAEAVPVAFSADTDVAWPDDELLRLGTLWKMQHADGLGDSVRFKEFDEAVVEHIWRRHEPKPYETIEPGLPRVRNRAGIRGDV